MKATMPFALGLLVAQAADPTGTLTLAQANTRDVLAALGRKLSKFFVFETAPRRAPRSGREEVVAPALRSLPSCPPINRDHARGHERKSEFCFEIGNETRNPPRHDHVPINCWGVACAQVAKKPNHKAGRVNRPADTFGSCHHRQASGKAHCERCGVRRNNSLRFH